MWKPDLPVVNFWYNAARKWFVILPALVGPLTIFINAPFGRFSPKRHSIFLVDGIRSWIVMELVSPILFTYSYLVSPLSPSSNSTPPFDHPSTLLATMFLGHYLNRALISPLRTPNRSKSHIIVPLAAVIFNVINGSLMGTYLSSPSAMSYLNFNQPRFWIGVVMWAVGLAGNILHDEVLLNLRRKSKLKLKKDGGQQNGVKEEKPHYSIPHGYLYNFISYPNYFCEWVEWLGFALAASPLPTISSGPAAFFQTVSPPWVFLIAEFCTMLPRAYKGHRWYHEKFPDYPKDRKIVVPFLF
ncbi:hypothetical protein JAAARDRAFT_159790 [Jaapia argillacea MUCL 33604]|uniref:3-oxo-5-alpha-steroid 4-dehydrogenase C-terminal domain-containing protein n=1 Tax=Jaapia argillacea MUCL 33604 TaxID=933084 RepID=A0A067PN46_9AGAM|nr:hypothetical protein JAAARDRAFT_159790 [Jaapia argillacea MUCL 33604]